MFVYRPHWGDHPRRIARLTPVSLHAATAGEWTTNSRRDYESAIVISFPPFQV